MASIFKQQYTDKDESGNIVRKQTQNWYIDYKAADGTRKRVKGFKDKAATMQFAAKLERATELAQAGISDRYATHRKKPLAEHLREFKESLLNKSATEKHASLVHNRVKSIVDACHFVYFGDISASKVQAYLADRRRGGLSKRSSNFYLQTIKQFCRWLVADGRMPENPLEYLKGLNPKTDIRRERRALTLEEAHQLIEVTSKGPKDSGMTGKERAMLYVLALNTGLRASELASLTWASFDFDNVSPTVRVLAAYSKHRRDDILPLRHDIAAKFEKWWIMSGEEADETVFPQFDSTKGARMLRRDLAVAGISYRDSAGRVIDFHALRHSFISNLNQSGASPKVAQSLARHSTISLTMDTYTHLGLFDERAAIDNLPGFTDSLDIDEKKTKEIAYKTGTDDLTAKGSEIAYKPAYKKLTEKSDSDRTYLSSVDTNESGDEGLFTPTNDDSKPLDESNLGSDCHNLAPVGKENGGGRIRTHEAFAQRFSRPPPSSTRPLLHHIHEAVRKYHVIPLLSIIYISHVFVCCLLSLVFSPCPICPIPPSGSCILSSPSPS